MRPTRGTRPRPRTRCAPLIRVQRPPHLLTALVLLTLPLTRAQSRSQTQVPTSTTSSIRTPSWSASSTRTPTWSVTPSPMTRAAGYDWSGVDAWLAATAVTYGPSGQNISGYESFGLLIGNTSGLLYTSTVGGFDLTEPISVGTSSQWMTASAIAAALRVSGYCGSTGGLNDRISRYIATPGGTRSPLANVTFRQLLSHTAGIGTSLDCMEDPVSNIMFKQYNVLTDNTSGFVSYPACLASALSSPLASAPGSAYLFSGASTQLAMAVASNAWFREYPSQQSFVYNDTFKCVVVSAACFDAVDTR